MLPRAPGTHTTRGCLADPAFFPEKCSVEPNKHSCGRPTGDIITNLSHSRGMVITYFHCCISQQGCGGPRALLLAQHPASGCVRVSDGGPDTSGDAAPPVRTDLTASEDRITHGSRLGERELVGRNTPSLNGDSGHTTQFLTHDHWHHW